MDGATIVQFKTRMDVNGNSRRCFAYLEHGLMLGVWRDNATNISEAFRRFNNCYAGLTIDVTPAQFRSLCKQGESLLYSAPIGKLDQVKKFPNAC